MMQISIIEIDNVNMKAIFWVVNLANFNVCFKLIGGKLNVFQNIASVLDGNMYAVFNNLEF